MKHSGSFYGGVLPPRSRGVGGPVAERPAGITLAGRAIAVFLLLVGLTVGLAVPAGAAAPAAGSQQPAQLNQLQLGKAVQAKVVQAKATAGCSGGRCTVYLSKAETRAFGEARIPAAPAGLPWQLRAGYYALAYAHVWFAQQYANRGWCSGFRLSIYPWESQGYFGYAC